jgi:hypothetical protein
MILLAAGLAPAAGLTFLCFAKEKVSKRKASQWPSKPAPQAPSPTPLSGPRKPNWVFKLPFTPAGVKGRGESGGMRRANKPGQPQLVNSSKCKAIRIFLISHELTIKNVIFKSNSI